MQAQNSDATKFEQRKDALLEALGCGSDRSKKGSFDAPINDMLSHLNMHPDYMSTSSCSGRIVLFREHGAGMGDNAKGGEWILCKHGTITRQELSDAMKRATTGKGLVYFRHEPFILHVQCKSLVSATMLMEVARAAGYRESGISVGKKHVIVGVRTSSLRMDSPVAEDGNQLVPEEYLDVLVRLANDKFGKNQDKTDNFYSLLKRDLLHSTLAPGDDGGGQRGEAGCGQRGGNGGGDAFGEGEGEEMMKHLAIACQGGECERVRSEAAALGWLDKKRRNARVNGGGGKIAVPLLPVARVLYDVGCTEGAALRQLIESGNAELVAQEGVCPPAGGGGAADSPHVRIRKELEALAKECGVQIGKAEVPLKRWEELGDLVMCPGDWLSTPPWNQLPEERVWKCVAVGLGKERIAVKAEVDEGPMRQSHAVLTYPASGADGWVKSVQHGLSFEWDVTKVMFSRGNVNERKRMGSMNAEGETLVDLFCGIGYFTVPLLASGRVSKAYACEWNPDSVEALRRNLEANGVSDKCEVLPGDNRQGAKRLVDIADRVLLGLLPSSEQAWPLAVGCLKPSGGWMHVHENVAEADMAAWTSKLERDIGRLGDEAGKKWQVKMKHLEKVKTYAPRIWHVVADVECRPA